MREVVVRTGARLHFGLFDLDPASDHQFAGVGMMVDSPSVTVRATILGKGDPDAVVGNASLTPRVLQFVERLREACDSIPAVRLDVPDAIPAHRGLGSGTQLAMAIGTAISRLVELDLTSQEIALATGRGRRSAIGVHGFDLGGFIVDGGHAAKGTLGSLRQRVAVPRDWRVVLVVPNDADGLFGRDELQAFGDLPLMPTTTSRSLKEMIDQEIIPTLQSADFAGFTTSLHEFGQKVGRFFAPVQGGTYRSATAANLADKLQQAGPIGVIQSSWGPTVAVFTPDDERARALAFRLQEHAEVEIARPLNDPAQVRVLC